MPVIVPVAGARSEQRVVENATDIPLFETDMAEIKAFWTSSLLRGIAIRPPLQSLQNTNLRVESFTERGACTVIVCSSYPTLTIIL
jgi:hypothetical protein